MLRSVVLASDGLTPLPSVLGSLNTMPGEDPPGHCPVTGFLKNGVNAEPLNRFAPGPGAGDQRIVTSTGFFIGWHTVARLFYFGKTEERLECV